MDKENIEYILNVLRRGTITWPGRNRCLNRGRYKKLNPKTGREVYWRDCDKCGDSYMLVEDLFEVDHIKEIGGFKGDWGVIIESMYCEDEGLQALCIPCHRKKTALYIGALSFKRKNQSVSEEGL